MPESGGKPTKVGEKVLQLQRMLPLARVVYCSATGETLAGLTAPAFSIPGEVCMHTFTATVAASHHIRPLQSIPDLSVGQGMGATGCGASAGASEPRNLGYMERLGLWGEGTHSFAAFQDFLDAVGGRGVGALELVAMDMKARGMFVCRTLSFQGAQASQPHDTPAFPSQVGMPIDG